MAGKAHGMAPIMGGIMQKIRMGKAHGIDERDAEEKSGKRCFQDFGTGNGRRGKGFTENLFTKNLRLRVHVSS
jgi:hypothetical protein